MSNVNIPTLEVPVGADFLFTLRQVRDQLGLLDGDDIDDATFTVEVFNAAPFTDAAGVTHTLNGALIGSSQRDFYAIWPDTQTVLYEHDGELWARYTLDIAADAKLTAFAKIKMKGD